MTTSDTTPERLFAANMKMRREHIGWSQSEMASHMTDLGYKWHPATVYSIEKGDRKIPLNEASAIALLMQTNVDDMLRPGRVVELQIEWDRRWEDFRTNATYLLQWAENYETSRKILVDWVQRSEREFQMPTGNHGLYKRTTKYSAVQLIGDDIDPKDKRTIQRLLSVREAARMNVSDGPESG